MSKILVTGAAGFIGSCFCRLKLQQGEDQIIAVDAMTYAASPRTLADLQALPGFSFHHSNICDAEAMRQVITETKPDAIVHFAAESHVDRSIDGAEAFIQTNIMGTFTLLEAARTYWNGMDPRGKNNFRFLHVSTDEVYGSLGHDGLFTEETPYAPNSPYSASKASSDHLVRAWCQTYGLPTLISNCSNNYGPYQFPEKLIPTIITKALAGEPLPVYGTGDNVRDWLYVEDHAKALSLILAKGRVGEKYLIGGDGEKTNLDLVRELCALLDERVPTQMPREKLITFVTDRPGHDKRYAMDYSKMTQELGWRPSVMLKQGLAMTTDWYLSNRPWWEEIKSGTYSGERLGMSVVKKAS